MKHEYADILRAIADDIATPVERSTKGKNKWSRIGTQSVLYTLVTNMNRYDLRLAPKTIRIGDMNVPEPMQVAPAVDTQYWYVDIQIGKLTSSDLWDGYSTDHIRLKRGLCHLNGAACRTHAEAIIKNNGGVL